MKQPDKLEQMNEELSNMNPQVRDLQIGVRDLRTIKIYPLSVGDEMKMTKLISENVAVFMTSTEAKNEVALVNFFILLVHENLEKFISLAIGEKGENGTFPETKEIIGDLTNLQLSELALMVYEINFEGSVKNFKNLFEQAKLLFPSERLSQEFVKDMGTDLIPSLKEPSEKEVLPESK